MPRQFLDRKSTRLNSSHVEISYAVFCLKKKSTFIATPEMISERSTAANTRCQTRRWRGSSLPAWEVSVTVSPSARTSQHCLFFFKDTAPPRIYTLSLHDALPI